MTIYNAHEFNMIGDGITNNSPQLKKIINFMESGDILYLPKGKYLINESLELTQGISLQGENWESIIIRGEELKNDPMIKCNNNGAKLVESSFICNLTLDGAKNDDEAIMEGNGIEIENTCNFFIKNILVINQSGTGIKLGGSALVNTIEITDCYIRNNNIYGIYAESYCSDIHIFHCDIGSNQNDNIRFLGVSSTIKNCTIWGSKKETGLRLIGQSNHVTSCQIEGNARHALLITGASHSSIRTNKIYASVWTGSYGIYIEKRGDYPVENIFIQGNMIYSSLSEGYSPMKRAIFINPEHKNIKVFSNNLSYLDLGEIDKNKRPYVQGLSLEKGDQWDKIDDPFFVKVKLSQNVTLKTNEQTTLLFNETLTDLSDVCSDGFVKIREDGVYQFSGELHLSNISSTNSSKLSLEVNGKLFETIAYYGSSTPSVINFTLPVLLTTDDEVTLNVVTVGQEAIVNTGTKLQIIKNI